MYHPHGDIAVTEVAVDAVGISHRNCGNARVTREHAVAAIAYGGSGLPLLDGDNHRVER